MGEGVLVVVPFFLLRVEPKRILERRVGRRGDYDRVYVGQRRRGRCCNCLGGTFALPLGETRIRNWTLRPHYPAVSLLQLERRGSSSLSWDEFACGRFFVLIYRSSVASHCMAATTRGAGSGHLYKKTTKTDSFLKAFSRSIYSNWWKVAVRVDVVVG